MLKQFAGKTAVNKGEIQLLAYGSWGREMETEFGRNGVICNNMI